jgi:hypothetical protein
MAAPTIAAKGANRELHCSTAEFTWSATAAGTYSSAVVIPGGAQVVSVSLKGGSTVPTTGTSAQVAVGGVAVSSAIAFAKYDGIGEQWTEASATFTDTTSDNGVIALITLGTHDAGSTIVSVCYIV